MHTFSKQQNWIEHKKNELLEVLTEAVVSVGVEEESLPAVALVHLVVQVKARLLARVPSLALTCK